MRPSTAQRRRSLATGAALALFGVVVLGFSASPASAQRPDAPGAPASDVSNIPKPITDTFDRVNLSNSPSNAQPGRTTTGRTIAENDTTCLLPPLTLTNSPTIAADQLRIAAKARKEYQQACAVLKDKKIADAERHLRNAVKEDPKYSAAWVTLGQVLATQGRNDEARGACFQGTIADPRFVPAFLCLADIAARAHAWDEVLKLSGRAVELQPSANAVAYEYHAAANLNLHNLASAEESGLPAVAIDKDHREPRVHFVLAQIYEAKGDDANEAVQLREYLKYSGSADDIAMVEQYLSKLEARTASIGNVDPLSGSKLEGSVRSSTGEVGPPDIDAAVPPVINGACPLAKILKEASDRTLDLIESLQRFSANERIEQIDIDKNGKRRNSTAQEMNYVVQIERNSYGYPSVQEYRSGNTSPQQISVMDSGTAAFALIFHPSHIENFDFRCEGLTELQGSAA